MVKWYLYWIGCAVLGLILGTGARWAVEPSVISEQQAYDSARSQTIMVLNPKNDHNGGTGFEVRTPSGRVYTLTNSHVCNLTDGAYLVARKDGNDRRIAILASAPEADLCLLEGIPGYKGLDLADSEELFEPTHIVGHPLLQPVTISSGYINGKGEVAVSYCLSGGNTRFKAFDAMELNLLTCVRNMRAYYTSANSLPGNSGSAVTNQYGEVVGVLFAGNGMGLSLIVPLDSVRAFLSAF